MFRASFARARGLGALLAALVLVLAACGADEPDAPAEEVVDGAADGREEADEDGRDTAGEAAEGEPDAAADVGDGLAAVSSAFPLAWLAAQIAPGADVRFLSAGGADPHDLELSPGDRALLETAHVVLYMGDLDFQPQVERAVQDATGELVDVRAAVGDDALIPFDDDHADDDHADDDHADDDHADDDHADDRGEYDPHLWFDAAVMADVVVEIGAAFARADGERAQAYEDNAAALRDDLVALHQELDVLLSDCRFDTAIVSHEAYAYLLEPRGLAQEGISGAGGHSEASPQRIAELSARIQEQGIPAVLAEPLHGRGDAEALASESGVELLTIDPLEIASDEDFDRGYLELLREQGERFATALDCRGGT